jgi:hypothetical protein
MAEEQKNNKKGNLLIVDDDINFLRLLSVSIIEAFQHCNCQKWSRSFGNNKEWVSTLV